MYLKLVSFPLKKIPEIFISTSVVGDIEFIIIRTSFFQEKFKIFTIQE